jgi:hypothetical protein
VPGVAGDSVVARAAESPVVAGARGHSVVARVARQGVRVASAQHAVVPEAAADHVLSGAPSAEGRVSEACQRPDNGIRRKHRLLRA